MNAFILFIVLITPQGSREMVMEPYATQAQCIAAQAATNAAPMGAYKLVSTECKGQGK